MSESMQSAFRRGAVSSRVLKKLRGTTSQPSKMAKFDSKTRNDGAGKLRGEVPSNEINHPTNQRAGSPRLAGGLPSRGAQTRGIKSGPGPDSINTSTGKKWPGASKMRGNKRRVGVKGDGGESAPSYYGGPSNRKYG